MRKPIITILAIVVCTISGPQAFGQDLSNDACAKAREKKSNEIWAKTYKVYLDHYKHVLKDNRDRAEKYLKNIEEEYVPEFGLNLSSDYEETVENITKRTSHSLKVYKKLSDTDLKYLITKKNRMISIPKKLTPIYDLGRALEYQAGKDPTAFSQGVALECLEDFDLVSGICVDRNGNHDPYAQTRHLIFYGYFGYPTTSNPEMKPVPSTNLVIKVCQSIPRHPSLKIGKGLYAYPNISYKTAACSIYNVRTKEWVDELHLPKTQMDLKTYSGLTSNNPTSNIYSFLDYAKSLSLKECKKIVTPRALPPEPKKKSKGIY